MYKDLSYEELNERLSVLDSLLNNGTETAKNMMKLFFKEVHSKFPLKDVMSENFIGNHSMILNGDGKLQLNVWCNDKQYTIIED